MNGHTPGPWLHYAARLRPQYPLRINEIHGPNGETIVRWSGFDGVGKKRAVTANARLIAAAPELLDALTATREWMRDDKWRNSTIEKHASWEAVMRGIAAAITKATGEQS